MGHRRVRPGFEWGWWNLRGESLPAGAVVVRDPPGRMLVNVPAARMMHCPNLDCPARVFLILRTPDEANDGTRPALPPAGSDDPER